ncbi:MAG: hypothetical protein H6838_09885 [Planctomycetes bacterium]|nr:hypothetical protein [Planctomycetota bacterium]
MIYGTGIGICTLAYLGPGGLLGSIGAFLALVGALLLAFLGLLWYPLKRLLAAMRKPRSAPPESAEDRGA